MRNLGIFSLRFGFGSVTKVGAYAINARGELIRITKPFTLLHSSPAALALSRGLRINLFRCCLLVGGQRKS